MTRFATRLKTAGTSGALTALMAISAFHVSADQNFDTDVEANQSRVPAIERAAQATPETVRKTGNMGSFSSVDDAGSNINSVVNVGAQKTKAQLQAAEAKIADLQRSVNQLKANAGATTEPTSETKTVMGYGKRQDCGSWNKWGDCSNDVRFYKKCEETRSYLAGTYIRSDYKVIGTPRSVGQMAWEADRSPFPGPHMPACD